MSELRCEFNTILLQAFAQVERMREKYPDDEHAMVGEDFYAGKLIDKVKAHIEECEKPENLYKCYCDKYSPHTMTKGQVALDAHYHGWEHSIKAFRRAIMKSLE